MPTAACATARTALAAAIASWMSGSIPVKTPAPPVTVATATRGAATRLVTGLANGTWPTVPSRIGVTASCAATVTPRAAPAHRGRIPENIPEPTRIPNVAATDS